MNLQWERCLKGMALGLLLLLLLAGPGRSGAVRGSDRNALFSQPQGKVGHPEDVASGEIDAKENVRDLRELRDAFEHPPEDCRIMMRWWWFGSAVTKPEIRRELEQMKAAGIGGVEIATLYPLALDDPQRGFHNIPFLSDEHIDALRYAASVARELGLRVDVTLGSGWPFGGPYIPVTQAAGAMRVEAEPIPSEVEWVAIPNLTTGEKIEAVFLVLGRGDSLALRNGKRIQSPAFENGRLQIAEKLNGQYTAVFFYRVGPG